jgi:hypothetical protein
MDETVLAALVEQVLAGEELGSSSKRGPVRVHEAGRAGGNPRALGPICLRTRRQGRATARARLV